MAYSHPSASLQLSPPDAVDSMADVLIPGLLDLYKAHSTNSTICLYSSSPVYSIDYLLSPKREQVPCFPFRPAPLNFKIVQRNVCNEFDIMESDSGEALYFGCNSDDFV